MPTYDYRCAEHGYFEARNSIADRAEGYCPTCGSKAKLVILQAPAPMIEAMADAGFPGAFHTSGDRLEKRHRAEGQYHTESRKQAAQNEERYQDFVRSTTVTPSGE